MGEGVEANKKMAPKFLSPLKHAKYADWIEFKCHNYYISHQ